VEARVAATSVYVDVELGVRLRVGELDVDGQAEAA
jgi:post-segregation antitoxin (ccd killing protein)